MNSQYHWNFSPRSGLEKYQFLGDGPWKGSSQYSRNGETFLDASHCPTPESAVERHIDSIKTAIKYFREAISERHKTLAALEKRAELLRKKMQ